MAEANPEIANSIAANGIVTNYHDQGSGDVVVLVHGSGPGVSAWANWRLTIPDLSKRLRVIAPDMAGFGFTERPEGIQYNLETWVGQYIGLLDALGIEKASIVGNSFGAALALAVAVRYPQRVNRLVLMGAMGIHAPLPDGLNAVWGYEPSRENMRTLVNLFAYNAVDLRNDILNGVIKSVVFGVAVTWIAVFEGYDAVPTAEGVSRATTRTVVTSSLAILALDFVLTALMFTGGTKG